ncbi:hypothetical protein HMPREF0083_02945 [Aneurinibacillus aneurinilyticus ATCC 12856]|uniref:Uncharacterized protein n=1 Tax=Aneurinibacillus aneurinilyticus ATCC 12856 TaxID=649747 RepID=U1Y9X8_ANEAE|nr:hypothetical protein HMPREF0083_02945 [Aneurinibacillus aneurinilyticus ATCC 12856]
MVGRRKFGKKKRVDAPCAPAEERPAVFFSSLIFTSYHKSLSIDQTRCI